MFRVSNLGICSPQFESTGFGVGLRGTSRVRGFRLFNLGLGACGVSVASLTPLAAWELGGDDGSYFSTTSLQAGTGTLNFGKP